MSRPPLPLIPMAEPAAFPELDHPPRDLESLRWHPVGEVLFAVRRHALTLVVVFGDLGERHVPLSGGGSMVKRDRIPSALTIYVQGRKGQGDLSRRQTALRRAAEYAGIREEAGLGVARPHLVAHQVHDPWSLYRVELHPTSRYDLTLPIPRPRRRELPPDWTAMQAVLDTPRHADTHTGA